MDLEFVEGDLAVSRLGAEEPLPQWAGEGSASGLLAVVRTAEELSIVCEAGRAPEGARSSGPWRAFRVAGTLDHALTGVLSSIAEPLARAGVPIFAISTFDTDYILVPGESVEDARSALSAAGHRFS